MIWFFEVMCLLVSVEGVEDEEAGRLVEFREHPGEDSVVEIGYSRFRDKEIEPWVRLHRPGRTVQVPNPVDEFQERRVSSDVVSLHVAQFVH